MSQRRRQHRQYRRRLAQALDNRFLGATLANFAAAYRDCRAQALAGLDMEALSQQIGQAKDQNLPRLMELYEQFKAQAQAAGAQVHLAADAAEANRIILDIAHRAGANKIVKSKSMTSEEIFLNRHLEQAGLEVVETDLGEWIIQLRREGPSHMVMPAIHLSRGQVADLFSRISGQAMDPDDIQAMVGLARQRLRQAFLEADMGISGANFALADSGALGLVTNEGNGRLVTTLPRVHLALVGLDKLLPDLGAALKILRVLPKSATGQAISSYVTWIKGAVACGPGPGGRKELHIVFLDNGRLALARDPQLSQALRCIRCGACANLCPIYTLVGGHNYGHVYIGAIGLILTYFYHGRDQARALARNCLNCRACAEVCPAGIDLPGLIKKVHALILSQERPRPAGDQLLARVLGNRRLFHFLLRRAYLAQQPLARGHSLIRHLPSFFGPEHDFRSLPAIVRRPLRDRWADLEPPRAQAGPRVALFAGCLIDFVYPEQAQALLKVLRGRQLSLEFPLEQTCCGLPALMMGQPDTARQVARQNLAALEPGGYDYILTLCASCASHLKRAYPELLAADARWAGPARRMAERVKDFSSFMVDVLGLEPRKAGQGEPTAYHAPCHLCRGLKVVDPPRKLLRAAGLDYRACPDEEQCCGFGGSYSLDFPEVSARILARKLESIQASGAGQLLTDCPGCVLQLRGGLDKRGSAIRVRHLAEALAEALADDPPQPD